MTIFLPAVWGALAILAGAPAQAAPACASIFVEADAAVAGRWPEMVERVLAAFAERRDIDACARVHLALVDGAAAGDSIDVRVSLPDGRSASRRARPDDVVAGLEALLLVPKEAAAAAPATPPTTAASTTFEPIALEVRREGGPPATRSPANAPSLFTAELSLLASVRRGDGQTSAGVGVSSFLEYAQWLVGFTARLDRYGDSATDENPDAPAAVEIGALAGRRFRFGRHFIFDAAAGPALALRGSWAVMTVNNASAGMPTTMRSSSSHNDLVPRLLLGGRLTLGARSKLRTFVGIEGELGEAGPIPPGATRGLPRWSVGAALGVTVGTL